MHGLGRIERLAGLGDTDAQRALGHHRVPVAEFTGDVDLGGQLDPALNGVLRHQRGVVAAAAGHDADLVDLAELLGAETHFVQDELPGRATAVQQRVGHRPWLLVHLLGHEVLEAVLLGRLEVPRDVQLLEGDRVPLERGHCDGAGGEHGHFVVGQGEEVTGMAEERRDVRSQERHVVAQPEYQWGGTAGRDDRVRLIGMEDGDGEGTPHAPERGPGGFGQRQSRRHLLLDEMGHHFGVGGRGHRVAGAHQLAAQRAVVLDDPVVDDGEAARAVEVGVGVLGRRVAVGGPAGVADARAVGSGCRHAGRRVRVAGRELRQVGHRAGAVGRPGPPDPPVHDERHPGRVVPPVLQAGAAHRG